jgi:glycosyltransferase involved in cell wall biosynthesis
MPNDLISIIIPTYQHAKTLDACLDSVFEQSYKNIQVIVVDDGSTDNTQGILEHYKDRIINIKQENQGSNPARNRGFQEASGDFVIFVDADVRMQPGMLKKMHRALMQNVKDSFAYCGFKFGWKRFQGIPFDGKKLKRMNYIHTTALVRKKDFPGFDNQIKRLQDWDVWLTMLSQGKTGVLIPEYLFSVEISGESRVGSSWLPSFFYKFPWDKIGWRPRQIQKYEDARTILQKKHRL